MLKHRTGPGNQLPIKHNQKKPFNPNKYGKLWSTISSKLMKGAKAKNPQGEANQPLICTLNIGNSKFELTHSECNRLIEEVQDAQSTYRKALRMGMLEHNSGTWEGYTK
tara:strand:- start:1789 stop:2115 length:327 start_codon:yes stop_codon:yes gene_type:complete